MTVNYREYDNDKQSFFKKHKHDFQCETSGLSADGVYHKTYTFKDGAVWYEVMSKETVEEFVEIRLCHIKVSVDLFRVEYWSSDNAESKYYYEPWDHTK